MKIEPHLVNFEHAGAFYTLDSGKVLYMAHRRNSELNKTKHAWGIERIALEKAIERGATAAGVIARQGKERLFYLTHIQDFFGPESFTNPKNILQRALPAGRFIVNPATCRETVERYVRLR